MVQTVSTILTIKNLSLRYRKADGFVLKNISLSVEKGSILSLVGESGSGKSSLLRAIAGLERPEGGIVVINGTTVLDDKVFMPPEKRKVGLVFQDYALFPHMTVGQNIAYGIAKSKDKSKRIAEVLALVKMQGYEKRFPHELSGGEQQRIALARALAPNPSLLLLDEPFSNLDETLKDKVREEICTIIKANGTTAILVTHDTRDAMATSDQIAVLHKGDLVQVAAPTTVYKEPKNAYVARFFGKVNVLAIKNNAGNLSSKAGDCTSFKSNLPKDFEGEIAIRPDDFMLSNEGLKGRVDRLVFQGICYELTVVCGTEKLLVNSAEMVAVGEEVGLRLKRGVAILL